MSKPFPEEDYAKFDPTSIVAAAMATALLGARGAG